MTTVLTNTVEAIVQPGQAIPFDRTLLRIGCNESTCGCCCNRLNLYKLEFTGNVSVQTAGDVAQLAIAVDGTALPATTMISTPSAINQFNNVHASYAYLVTNRNGAGRVTVINTGTVPFTIAANANLIVDEDKDEI